MESEYEQLEKDLTTKRDWPDVVEALAVWTFEVKSIIIELMLIITEIDICSQEESQLVEELTLIRKGPTIKDP